jgi:antitoxin (DNA-binding transcriptional repressor) of toxin-antitoxin stability system
MGVYTVAKAKENLSGLTNSALNGEGVEITRDGAPVAALRVVRPAPGPITAADLAWLDVRRVTRKNT